MATLRKADQLASRGNGVPDDGVRLPVAGFLAALVGQRIVPALRLGLAGDPVHVAVVGGTNSGKSTVLNVLLGRAAAGMSPLARWSQCPEAFHPATVGEDFWRACPSRFAGYRRLVDERPPRQSDEDLSAGRWTPVFSVHKLPPADPEALLTKGAPGSAKELPPAAPRAVWWDLPDFSTQEARAYLPAVMDGLATADVVLFAVTEESYADDRGLQLLAEAARATAVLLPVINKGVAARGLLEDVRSKLETRLGRSSVMLVLPRTAAATPEGRWAELAVTDEAAVLRGTVAHDANRGADLKRESLEAAVAFARARLDDALRPLDDEAAASAGWARTVGGLARTHVLDRHGTEYLEGRQYGEFNRTLVKLMELLSVPGIGPVLKVFGNIVRTPFRVVRGLFQRLVGDRGAKEDRAPEHEVLAGLVENWLGLLRSEAQRQAAGASHAAWRKIAADLDSHAFRDRLYADFAEGYADYQTRLTAEIDTRAKAIYERLEQRPWLLNSLRAGNVLINAGSTLLVVKSGGLNWSDAVVGPLTSGLMHMLLEEGLEQYVEGQKARLKRAQAEMMAELIETRLGRAVRGLFPDAEGPAKEAEQARRDFATVAAAAGELLRRAE